MVISFLNIKLIKLLYEFNKSADDIELSKKFITITISRTDFNNSMKKQQKIKNPKFNTLSSIFPDKKLINSPCKKLAYAQKCKNHKIMY